MPIDGGGIQILLCIGQSHLTTIIDGYGPLAEGFLEVFAIVQLDAAVGHAAYDVGFAGNVFADREVGTAGIVGGSHLFFQRTRCV